MAYTLNQVKRMLAQSHKKILSIELIGKKKAKIHYAAEYKNKEKGTVKQIPKQACIIVELQEGETI